MEFAAGGAGTDTFKLTNTGANGVLTLNGHTGTNALQVARNADFTLRNANLTIGGLATAQAFGLANIQQATINGGAGNNYINASAYTGKATINGGDGNDVIVGGKGNDILNGGNGNDWLGGLAGNDILYGMNGRDILVGGDGSDQLNTTNTATSVGDDLLIGGKTIYDTNKAAIDAILASWVSSLTYANHIKALATTGVGPTKQYKLNSTSVLNDNASDILFGGGGTDWFFAITTGTNKDTHDATGIEQVA